MGLKEISCGGRTGISLQQHLVVGYCELFHKHSGSIKKDMPYVDFQLHNFRERLCALQVCQLSHR
jgi:hypothetical protein